MTVEPIQFGDDDRPLAGWVHLPDGDAGAIGVVICNPFGYEAVCAHRSLRHVAEQAAAAGIPAMRFDYDGTGDSAGDDLDPGRFAAWVGSVHKAVDALKRRASVEQVALFGLRLGVLVAAFTAGEREDIAGLLAFAPVISGKAYLRELKILQGALGLTPAPAELVTDATIQEALGFRITEETRAALQKADLAKQDRPPAPRVLVLDRDDLPAADKWIEVLKQQGATVDARRVPGYVDMVLDPHKAIVPTAAIASSVDWLRTLSGVRTPPLILSAGLARGASPKSKDADQAIKAGPLTGFLTRPVGTPSGRAFLMLNAGAVHHVGPNRLYTAFARRWAARGHLCLRVDITGIGDTPPRAGAPENVVYGPRAVDDAGEAIAWLRAQPGITDVRALGLCSGAYHAFKAAVAGHPVDGVVVINPLTFFWKEGQSLDYPEFKVAGDAARYGRSVRDPAKWRKLLRGEVDLRAVAQTMSRHAASVVVNRARDVSRRLGRPWKDDLGAELESLAARGVDLRFVFATGDPGLDLLESQGGAVVPAMRASGELTIDLIDGPDHTFTPVWTHDVLAGVLDRALGV